MYTIYDLFKRTAASYSRRPSLIFKDKTFTFRDIDRRVNALADSLYKLGCRPGMTIGLLMYNGVDFFSLFYAVHKLGCVLMPLNWRLTAENILEHIKLSECKVLIYDKAWSDCMAAFKPELCEDMLYISNGTAGELELEDLLRDGDPEWQFKPNVGPDDPAQYLTTGGTSANSKIAVATHKAMLMRTLLPRLYGTLDYSYEDNFLLFNPMFHQGGIGIYLPVSVAGGCLTILEKMDSVEIIKAIDKYRITRLLLLPPSLCNRIKSSPDLQKYDLGSVKIVMLSGGASSMDLAAQVFETFPNAKINTSYGATENAAETMHVYSREEYEANPRISTSIGKASPFTEIKLVDADSNPVPDGETGECYGRAAGMFCRYIGRPSPFVDGWFPTGDYLLRDERGYYYFKDRNNFVIKSGGELVYPSEVEQAILKHPKIAEAAVFGTSDSDYGEMVTAAVVLKKGETLSEEDVINFVRQEIASYKKPKKVFFLDSLAYTSVGKVDKRALQAITIEKENTDK